MHSRRRLLSAIHSFDRYSRSSTNVWSFIPIRNPENALLAIVHLAQSPAPLTGHSHGVRSFLGECTGIDYENSVGFTYRSGHLPSSIVEQRPLISHGDSPMKYCKGRDFFRLFPRSARCSYAPSQTTNLAENTGMRPQLLPQ